MKVKIFEYQTAEKLEESINNFINKVNANRHPDSEIRIKDIKLQVSFVIRPVVYGEVKIYTAIMIYE